MYLFFNFSFFIMFIMSSYIIKSAAIEKKLPKKIHKAFKETKK